MFGINFSQASTWKSLVSLITGIGLFSLTDVQLEAASTAAAAVYVFLSLIINDKIKVFGSKKTDAPAAEAEK
jgi:hypothetical protein